MKHVITFEEEDLIQHIKDMLAMRGVAPDKEIKIIPVEEPAGQDADGNMCMVTRYQVNVTCRERDLLTHCPLCKHSLVEVKESEKPAAAVRLVTEAQEEPEAEEPEEPRESVILDESLGESLEPPEPPTYTSKRGDGGGPSIASLRAQSDRVRREREPTLPRRPKGTKA